MRCVLECTLLILLLAGVGSVRAQDATFMHRSGPVVDNAEWEKATTRTPTADSARWRLWQVIRTRSVLPLGAGDRLPLTKPRRTQVPRLMRQWGVGTRVLGRAPGVSFPPAGPVRILQAGYGNVVLPMAIPEGRSVLDRSSRATIRQMERGDLVRQIVQSGAITRVDVQQRGTQNSLRMHQAGVDSTARVRQDGAGNTAVVVQNGSDV